MSAEAPQGYFPPVPDAPPAPSPQSHYAAPPPPVERPRRFGWALNLLLFVITVGSVLFVGQMYAPPEATSALGGAAYFAVPLLLILTCHEFGHYIAARLHRVPASLPYFLPLPILNPFGTLGAIIVMPERIRSRKALLDIGAAGPLAGLVVAIPLMLVGLARSPVIEQAESGYVQEGQSLLYWALKRVMVGELGPTQDIATHPIALAAWAGFFVTFLNLLPFGQLDGGHVAYALFGRRQDRLARWVKLLPLGMALVSAVRWAGPPLWRGAEQGWSSLPLGAWLPASSALNWLVLYGLLSVLERRTGREHPPVDDHALGLGRRLVGGLTLAFYVLLFMPFPWVVH